MTCPQCQSTDVDESGTCRVCGFRPGEPPPETDSQNDRKPYSGPFEMDYSDKNEQDPQELPEWRKELSRRLQEIKQKREELPGETPPAPEEKTVAIDRGVRPSELRKAASAPAAKGVTTPDAPLAAAEPGSQPPGSLRQPAIPQKRAATPRVSRILPEGQEVRSGVMPLFQKPPETKPVAPKPEEVKDVIDRAVGRQIATSDTTPFHDHLAVAVPPGEPAAAVNYPKGRRHEPDRLILLTRTLSGLVDLIIVASCTLSVLAATDFVAGIGNVDWLSVLVYSTLLVLIFLLYSIFFLGTANQTIGMMITDLRILSDDRRRPGFRKVLARSSAYLLSLLPAGVGLLWGCFDGECRCWHDRLSGTRVVRLS
jgi:uncharacterized RDD family membrane protein YckC